MAVIVPPMGYPFPRHSILSLLTSYPISLILSELRVICREALYLLPAVPFSPRAFHIYIDIIALLQFPSLFAGCPLARFVFWEALSALSDHLKALFPPPPFYIPREYRRLLHDVLIELRFA
ncbi:hypothetical protein H0H87_008861 [Tephrocybe sp. NHM501043]|nr:hypothetical protein H0H87_008861 [Tephrocybe sp. NHM501043]